MKLTLKLSQLAIFILFIFSFSYAAELVTETDPTITGLATKEYAVYYENGFVQEKGFWADGKNYGAFKRYFENGNISQEFFFNEKGRRTGVQKYYYDNGQLRVIGSWKDGNEDGDIISYHENGTIKNIKQYSTGDLIAVINDDTEINNYLSSLEEK